MGILKVEGVVYKAVEDVDLGPHSPQPYIHANVKAPRLAGFLVKIFVWFLESSIFGPLLLHFLKRNNLIHKLVSNAELQESPFYVPLHPFLSEEKGLEEVKEIEKELGAAKRVEEAIKCMSLSRVPFTTDLPFRRWTILDYFTAYSSRQITPLTVAERIIEAIGESCSQKMAFFINFSAEDILRQASDSTSRYQRGEQISVLDGVPIAVKDEIDCNPYPTTGGTKWLDKVRKCEGDAYSVKCLRSCGAVLIGKTNMHELGAGTSGINPHYGATRNPYDIGRIAGGSSSGSAAVVAAGLCPVALGVDGGGSVRMPAALCGVVGFKPTFGRLPHAGVIPLNWTVGMVGVLAATIEDAFITYAAMSGEHPSNQLSILPSMFVNGIKHYVYLQTKRALEIIGKPKLYFPLLNSSNPLSNIKLAIYREWFNDCRDEIKVRCSNAVDQLCKSYGWKIVEVTIPEIEAMRLAHYVTIGTECTASLSSYLEKLNYGELGWDVRVALSVYGAFSGKDYVKAQKLRNRVMQFHKSIFAKADVIVTPTTGVTAYPILDDTKKTGELDYINGAALVRYQIAGNFLGLPAITVPVGYDKKGLPIGLQFIGKPWSETTLLHIASSMQDLCISDYTRPQVFYDLLKDSSGA